MLIERIAISNGKFDFERKIYIISALDTAAE